MANRIEKGGLDAEVVAKIDSKYDKVLAERCMKWIKACIDVSGQRVDLKISGERADVFGQLKDGRILARLANAFKPKIISEKVIEKANMPFKQMELIGHFLQTTTSVGVPDYELFMVESVDLYENQNLQQVIVCLASLAKRIQFPLIMDEFSKSESDLSTVENLQDTLDEQKIKLDNQRLQYEEWRSHFERRKDDLLFRARILLEKRRNDRRISENDEELKKNRKWTSRTDFHSFRKYNSYIRSKTELEEYYRRLFNGPLEDCIKVRKIGRFKTS
ncbi:DgyrCDS12346 [Dimorphilus gyrociliatus]|uniref:DgyrCDS12346 n=1 Tax=Dimorphilus gyrociliatus TaxID=2664684 RepID=A0A7I8W664_9ANNE|nr:DgyrCDS12346 [Dimorphilus gyrociliatus]